MISPLSDMILVLPDPDSEPGTTPGGIVLPKVQEQQIATATVVRVGPGRVDTNGDLVPMPVSEGDKILLARASGLSIYVDGKLHKMMPASQVLAVVAE